MVGCVLGRERNFKAFFTRSEKFSLSQLKPESARRQSEEALRQSPLARFRPAKKKVEKTIVVMALGGRCVTEELTEEDGQYVGKMLFACIDRIVGQGGSALDKGNKRWMHTMHTMHTMQKGTKAYET